MDDLRKFIKNIIKEFLNEQKEDENNLNSNFWKWFGNSKIKESNNPMILFHGTKTKFSSFDDRKKGSSTDSGLRGRGFYFSTNIKSAQSYGGNVYEVYLKMENPFDLLSFNSLEEIAMFLFWDSNITKEL